MSRPVPVRAPQLAPGPALDQAIAKQVEEALAKKTEDAEMIPSENQRLVALEQQMEQMQAQHTHLAEKVDVNHKTLCRAIDAQAAKYKGHLDTALDEQLEKIQRLINLRQRTD